jgi:hypothetical protein
MARPTQPKTQVTIHLDEPRLQAIETLRIREQRSRANMIALLVAEALERRGITLEAPLPEPSRGE